MTQVDGYRLIASILVFKVKQCYEKFCSQLCSLKNDILFFQPEMSLVLYPLFVHLYLELVYKELEVEGR